MTFLLEKSGKHYQQQQSQLGIKLYRLDVDDNYNHLSNMDTENK